MIINGVDYGRRSTAQGIPDAPVRWYSMGVSMAGDVVNVQFGTKHQDIPVFFQVLSEAQKNTLKSYLVDTIKPGNFVTVTPDTGDDLQIGASGATSLLFLSFDAQRVAYNLWSVSILFRKYNP